MFVILFGMNSKIKKQSNSYWPLLMVIISSDRMVDEIYQNNVQPVKSGLGSLSWARFWSGLELK